MPQAVPFPDVLPDGFEWLDDEPIFDPQRHLALETPEAAHTLAELGYSDAEIEPTATPLAVSHPFRVLSDEGAAVMLETSRRLRAFQKPAGNRIENTVRGACYRSKWLRDLAIDPSVAQAMGHFYQADIAPHSMPLHLAHLNYEPTNFGDAVDKWHHDTIPLDYVLMVTDPATVPGGGFEYFLGTKAEAAELASKGQRPSPDRVVTPVFPGPGYAIALHGNMVVHRAAALTAPGERITMVNAYVALDTAGDDQSRSQDLIGIDPDQVLYAEWSRHVAWRARTRLAELEAAIEFGVSADEAAAQLEHAIIDIEQAVTAMRAGSVDAAHYEHPTP